MTEWNGVTAEELIKWLNKVAGDWAGIGASDGKIFVFDSETGEDLDSIEVEHIITNNKVTVSFEGIKADKLANDFYIDFIDGGLEDIVIDRLNHLGYETEISNVDNMQQIITFSIP